MENNWCIRNLSSWSIFFRINCSRIIKRFESRTWLNFCLSCTYKLIVRIKFTSAHKSIDIAIFMIQCNHRAFNSSFFIFLFCNCSCTINHINFEFVLPSNQRQNVKNRINLTDISIVCNLFSTFFTHF